MSLRHPVIRYATLFDIYKLTFEKFIHDYMTYTALRTYTSRITLTSPITYAPLFDIFKLTFENFIQDYISYTCFTKNIHMTNNIYITNHIYITNNIYARYSTYSSWLLRISYKTVYLTNNMLFVMCHSWSIQSCMKFSKVNLNMLFRVIREVYSLHE